MSGTPLLCIVPGQDRQGGCLYCEMVAFLYWFRQWKSSYKLFIASLVCFVYLSVIKSSDWLLALEQCRRISSFDTNWGQDYLASASQRYNLLTDSALQHWRNSGDAQCTIGEN